jgi:hypothetical protein
MGFHQDCRCLKFFFCHFFSSKKIKMEDETCFVCQKADGVLVPSCNCEEVVVHASCLKAWDQNRGPEVKGSCPECHVKYVHKEEEKKKPSGLVYCGAFSVKVPDESKRKDIQARQTQSDEIMSDLQKMRQHARENPLYEAGGGCALGGGSSSQKDWARKVDNENRTKRVLEKGKHLYGSRGLQGNVIGTASSISETADSPAPVFHQIKNATPRAAVIGIVQESKSLPPFPPKDETQIACIKFRYRGQTTSIHKFALHDECQNVFTAAEVLLNMHHIESLVMGTQPVFTDRSAPIQDWISAPGNYLINVFEKL